MSTLVISVWQTQPVAWTHRTIIIFQCSATLDNTKLVDVFLMGGLLDLLQLATALLTSQQKQPTNQCQPTNHSTVLLHKVPELQASTMCSILTRHRVSTSMYSLTFRIRVTTPPQYGRNGTAHAAGASILSPARAVFAGMRNVRVRHACGVQWAWRITAGLCHAFP